jgi:hypothetical protein
MDEIEALRNYAARSAPSTANDVDVTASVMQTLRNRREDRFAVPLRPLVMVAAASWVGVIATGIFVQEAWSILQDPIASLIAPFVVAMQ